MNSIFSRTRTLVLVSSLTATVLVAGGVGAQAAVSLPPNLKPLPASNLSLVADTSGTSTLRFSTTSWNNGSGPLEIIAGEVETGSRRQKVFHRGQAPGRHLSLRSRAMDNEILVTRILDAPCERGFKAWTDPGHMAQRWTFCRTHARLICTKILKTL